MTKSPKLPDFFLLGAPKCGINAIYSYLGEHSQVTLPVVKEPHFFSADMPGLAQVDDERKFLKLFEHCPVRAITGEASVWYLFSEAAVPRILEANPRAKLIVSLRNPIDAAHALHSQFLRSAKEDVPDFKYAWHLQSERRRGRSLPRYCPEPRCLQYREVYSFTPQIRRLLDAAPEGQVKIIIFEEFFADPRRHYLDLLEFLELEDDKRVAFPAVNENRLLRSHMIASLPAPLARQYNALRRVAHLFGIKPAAVFDRVAFRPGPRPKIDSGFRSYLASEYSSDVDALECLLGRELAPWRMRDCFSPVSADNEQSEVVDVSNLRGDREQTAAPGRAAQAS